MGIASTRANRSSSDSGLSNETAVAVLADQKNLKAVAVRGEPGPYLAGTLAVVKRFGQNDRPFGHALGGRLIDAPLRFGSGIPARGLAGSFQFFPKCRRH
jgi:hypothetical protein